MGPGHFRGFGPSPTIVHGSASIQEPVLRRGDVRKPRLWARPCALSFCADRLAGLADPTHMTLMEKLTSLWRGDLSLGEAVWTWAVLGGLLVNVTTSIAFLVLLSMDQPWPALIVGYGCSVPYNVVVVVGVWRSAARYNPPHRHGDSARVAVLVLMTVLSLT